VSDELSDKEIRALVQCYLKRCDLMDHDDPYSDLAKLSEFAMSTTGAKALVDTTQSNLGAEFPRKKVSFEGYVRVSGQYLESLNPSYSSTDWGRLFAAILCERYGGNYVRLRKRPKAKLLLDARLMTTKQLMEKHPEISRSYAYQLRKEALQKK